MSESYERICHSFFRLLQPSDGASGRVSSIARLLTSSVGPVTDPIDYRPVEGIPPTLCRPVYRPGPLYNFTASNGEYGLPTNRDPIANTPRAGGVAHPHGPPKWALTHIARMIVYWRAVGFTAEANLSPDEFNRKVFELEYLQESGLFKMAPTYQWVFNGTNSMPVIDLDVLPNGEQSLGIVMESLAEFFKDDRFKPVVFTRQASADQIKAHIYLTGLFLGVHDIKRICKHITDDTGIDVDMGLYNGRHTLRLPGCFKNSHSFGSGRQRLADIFDPDLVGHMNIRFTHDEYVAQLIDVRKCCEAEQCGRIYSSGGQGELDPFADQFKRNRLAGAMFCPKCARICWEQLLELCYPFCPPTAAKVKDGTVLTILNSALRPKPVTAPVRTASSSGDNRLSSPFESIIYFDVKDCSMSVFSDRLFKEFGTLPKFCPSSGAFFELCYEWFDRLTLLVSRYVARHSEGKCIWLLAIDGEYGKGVVIEQNNEFIKSTNFPRNFVTYCNVETSSPGLLEVFKTLEHPLAQKISIKNNGKKDNYALELKIGEADLVSICSTLNRLSRVAWTPYNHLIEVDREMQKVNSYIPPMLHQVEVGYEIRDTSDFLAKFNHHMLLSFRHLFLNEQPGWTKDDCVRLFILFWRFVALKIRFPGGYNKDGICLSRPDLVWWFTGWEGCGKTTSILNFFTAFFVYVADVRNMDSKFDTVENFREKIFSIFDEAGPKDANLLKSFTNKRMSAARKYLSNIEFNNHSSLILLCNEVSRGVLCGIDVSDRRNVVLRCLNRMPKEDRSFIPSLTVNPDYLEAFFYCFSLGFPDDYAMHCDPLVSELITRLNEDCVNSVGDWDSRFDYFSFWASIAAPWTPAKKAILERAMDAPKKFLLQWLEKGINFSAAFKFLPSWLVKDPKWWDRDGYWLRMIPINNIHQIYAAFTTASTATSQIDWEDLIRKFFAPSQNAIPLFDLSERIDRDISDLECAIFHSSSGSFFLIPPFEQCVENFTNNCQWFGWEPLYVYSHSGPDYYSHHMARYLSGYHLSQATDADTHRPVYHEDIEPLEDVKITKKYTQFPHLQISRLAAAYYVLFSSTQEMQKKVNALMHEQVVKEIFACREGRGIYRDAHMEANTIESLKRTLSFSQARNSQDTDYEVQDDLDIDILDDEDQPTQKIQRN